MAERPIALTRREADALKRLMRSEQERLKNSRVRRRRHVTGGGNSGAGEVIMFRLEEELLRGSNASARMVDPSSLTTKAGAIITVYDDEKKWFGRGTAAESGDDGGDARGTSNLGWCSRKSESNYSIISMGTWYRWIQGTLAANQDANPWRAMVADCDGWDGEWVRPDDTQESGAGGEYITLNRGCVPDASAADAAFFIAVFDEIDLAYRLLVFCCQ